MHVWNRNLTPTAEPVKLGAGDSRRQLGAGDERKLIRILPALYYAEMPAAYGWASRLPAGFLRNGFEEELAVVCRVGKAM